MERNFGFSYMNPSFCRCQLTSSSKQRQRQRLPLRKTWKLISNIIISQALFLMTIRDKYQSWQEQISVNCLNTISLRLLNLDCFFGYIILNATTIYQSYNCFSLVHACFLISCLFSLVSCLWLCRFEIVMKIMHLQSMNEGIDVLKSGLANHWLSCKSKDHYTSWIVYILSIEIKHGSV